MLSDVLLSWNAVEVSAMDFYKDIFKLGEGYIQNENESSGLYKANPIGYWKNNGEDHGHFRILFEDTFEDILKQLQDADFALLNCISYFGRRRDQEHASKMFSMIFDLDGVADEKLNNFLSGAVVAKVYPVPNYVVLSGHNVHLYYNFENPISLFPNTKLQLKELKYALTEKIWNPLTSNLESVQKQGIFQAFRVIGGKTKSDASESFVRAFRLNEHPWSLDRLCDFVSDDFRVDEMKVFKETKYTLEEAKKLFPKWYEKVIVNKDTTQKKWDIKGKVHGDDPYALYHWWMRMIKEGAMYTHRYFCVMALAIYATKNDVPYDILEKDALDLIPLLNAIEPSHPFTESDVTSALECYDSRYCTFPREDIKHLTAIEIPVNKRNHRPQAIHMKYMNNQKKFKAEIGECTNGGRPSKEAIVQDWCRENPLGTKYECSKQTGLDPKTVRKWWSK